METGIDEKLGQHIPPDLIFTDEKGSKVISKELFTRPVILSLIYYNCRHICPALLSGLTEAADAMTIKATGRLWSWQFEYDNGIKSGELKVPLGKPVKLLITSQDVLHSLFIPAFRIKEDAVPGMETFLWFLPDKTGEYDLFCSEYCGVQHSSMVSKVIVTEEDDFNAWYNDAGKPETGAGEGVTSLGHVLLEDKGCLGCHTVDGTVEVGPSFKGVFGRKAVVVTGGREREIVADEEYLKKSVLHPDADIVKGFDDIMPSQEGNVSEKEINEIITYLKGLK